MVDVPGTGEGMFCAAAISEKGGSIICVYWLLFSNLLLLWCRVSLKRLELMLRYSQDNSFGDCKKQYCTDNRI